MRGLTAELVQPISTRRDWFNQFGFFFLCREIHAQLISDRTVTPRFAAHSTEIREMVHENRLTGQTDRAGDRVSRHCPDAAQVPTTMSHRTGRAGSE